MNPKIIKFFSLKWYFLVLLYVFNFFVIYAQGMVKHECGWMGECSNFYYLFWFWGLLLFPLLVIYTIVNIVIHIIDKRNKKVKKKEYL